MSLLAPVITLPKLKFNNEVMVCSPAKNKPPLLEVVNVPIVPVPLMVVEVTSGRGFKVALIVPLLIKVKPLYCILEVGPSINAPLVTFSKQSFAHTVEL